MNIQRKKGFTALFLVCGISGVTLTSGFAADSSTSTVANVASSIWDGAISTWNWGRSTANVLSLIGTEKVTSLKIPVLGIKVSQLADSWGDARSGGRSHEGIDILAPRNTPIISPTKAVVSDIGYGTNGGNYVYTINPGGERFYYAHLDSYAEGLVKGKILEPGDVIGYVGNTGNASGGPTHLHFGIYQGGASNPYPRLTSDWTSDELVAIKTNISGTENAVAAVASNSQSSTSIESLTRNLTVGSRGEDVKRLQKFLNAHGAPVAASGPGSSGNETTYFGQATKLALAAYQRAHAISPSAGYLGPITRSVINKQVLAMK